MEPPDPSIRRVPISAAQRAARLAKNALANLVRVGTSWIIVLLVPPLLVHHLDKPLYATWMLVLQVSAYASQFDGGLQISIGRFVARAQQANDRSYLAEILSSATALLSGGAVLLLVLVVLGSVLLGRLFPTIPDPLVGPASLTLLLVGGSLAITFPANVLAGFSLGLETNQINAIAGGVARLVGATGAVWAAIHHQGLVAMGAWTAAGTLVQPIIFVVAGRRHGLRSLIHFGLARARMGWEFAGFCAAMMASQLGALLITGLDLPIVVAFDFRDAGYYAIATTASNALIVPFGSILSTLVPALSSMSMGAAPEQMGQVLLRTTRLSTTLLALLAVPLMAGMPLLLRLWVGADYATHAALFAELLVAAQVVRLSLAPYTLIAFSAGEQRKVLISSVGEGIVNLLLSLLLARHIGAAGVAAATLVGAFAGIALHFWNSMARTRSMQFEKKQLLLEGILVPSLLAGAFGAGLGLLLPFVHPVALQLLLLCGSVCVLGAVMGRFILPRNDRALIRTLAARVLPTLRRRIEV